MEYLGEDFPVPYNELEGESMANADFPGFIRLPRLPGRSRRRWHPTATRSTAGRVPEIHISEMRFCKREDAAEIADYVLEVLEEDLFHYFNSFQTTDYGAVEAETKGSLDRESDG